MDIDYYSILAKAVAGKDEAARNRIYDEAWNLIRKSSRLTREAAVEHAAALKDAVRRIEDEIAAEGARPAADVSAVLLSANRNWRPAVVVASALLAVIALSAMVYGYVTSKRPVGAGVTASSSRPVRGREEAV